MTSRFLFQCWEKRNKLDRKVKSSLNTLGLRCICVEISASSEKCGPGAQIRTGVSGNLLSTEDHSPER